MLFCPFRKKPGYPPRRYKKLPESQQKSRQNYRDCSASRQAPAREAAGYGFGYMSGYAAVTRSPLRRLHSRLQGGYTLAVSALPNRPRRAASEPAGCYSLVPRSAFITFISRSPISSASRMQISVSGIR